MNISRRFIIGLSLGLALGSSAFIVLLYSVLGAPTESSRWISDLYERKGVLATNVSGSRLILVAGSSALFGINAERITQQTGCHTLNLGTYAGLYLDYILYKAETIARPGDTVLLACEYELYPKRWVDTIADDYILARDPAYFREMPLLKKLDMATRISFERLQRGWNSRRAPAEMGPPTPPYTPYTTGINTLNDNGDEILNFESMRPGPKPEMRQISSVLKDGMSSERTEGFNLLADFIQWAQARHITVLATFPNIVYQSAYEGPNGRKTLDLIAHFYTSRGVPVIGDAREVMLPFGDFFDTNYHLTHEAALKRTDRLIQELRPYLLTRK